MVKAVNIAAPGFLVVLLAAASFDRPVRGPFIAYVVNQLSGTVTAFNTRTRMVFGPIEVGNNPNRRPPDENCTPFPEYRSASVP